MQLERLTAEIRPRNAWESIDLGFALVRRDFWRLWGIWWAAALPWLAVILLLREHPLVWMMLFWWCKPEFSRMVLHDLSRALFGERPGWRELLRVAVVGGWRNFGRRMVWGRLSPRRLLAMPVEELEGLSGTALRQRSRIMLRRGGGSVVALTIVSVVMVAWVALTLWLGLAWLAPEGQGRAWRETWELWRAGQTGLPPLLLGWTFAAVLALALSLVDVFAIGAGFGLYLNNRSWIEGWDVELVFKRLAERMRRAGLTGLALMFAFSPGAEAAAEKGPGAWGEEREIIERILAEPEFEVHTETIRVPRIKHEFELPDWLLSVYEVLGWVLLIGVVVTVTCLAVWLFYRYRHALRGSGNHPRRQSRKAHAVVVGGLAIDGADLPPDPPAVAARLWAGGKRREALALLYRAAIAWLIEHRQLELGESSTEYDCVRRVAAADSAMAGYFQALTEVWIRLAYGARTIADEEVEKLCREWPFRTGGAA